MGANISAMTWWEYVRTAANTEVQTVIAERSGIAQATISRWKLGKQAVDARSAIDFAHAFDRPSLEALVAAGFLTADEAQAQVTITRQDEPSDDELLDLIRRRLERDREDGEGHGDQPAPIDEVSRAEQVLLVQMADEVTLGELRATAHTITHERVSDLAVWSLPPVELYAAARAAPTREERQAALDELRRRRLPDDVETLRLAVEVAAAEVERRAGVDIARAGSARADEPPEGDDLADRRRGGSKLPPLDELAARRGTREDQDPE